MLIKSISLKNFRCVRNATLPCEKLTALLGRNGSGKSTVLHALVMFYDTKAQVTADDFYCDPETATIEITVRYCDLSSQEQSEFASYLQDRELTIIKKIRLNNGKVDQRYYAATRQIPQLADISKLTKVTDKRSAWNGLISSQAVLGLTRTLGNRDNPDTAIEEFTKAHPELTEWVEREEQFFGPKNVGGGKLDKYTKFVYVPAVRDVSTEIADKRGSVLSELLEMIVMRRFMARPEVKQLKADFRERIQQIYNEDNLQEYRELADSISAKLHVLVPNSTLSLKPSLPAVPEIPVPVPLPTLTEDDYEGAIDRKGHGLQRALIFSLLQYLALAKPAEVDDTTETLTSNKSTIQLGEPEQEQAEGNSDIQAAADKEYLGPDLVIAIEEPELYQHPLRARHLSKVLLSMTETTAPDGGRNQVFYSTHSPHFVDVNRFEQLRIARKHKCCNGGSPYSEYTYFSIHEACNELARISQLPRETFTSLSFRARTYPVMTNLVNEGFFADVVVIVEGQTEIAALLAVAEKMEIDWTAKGVAVIAVEGKSKIDRPVVIFRGFGIPTYFIFDGDKQEIGKKRKSAQEENQRLLRLASVEPEDFPLSGARSNFACFENNFEDYCQSVLGADQYEELMTNITDRRGLSRSSGMKNFDAVCDFVQQVYDRGLELPVLEEVVQYVTKLADNR